MIPVDVSIGDEKYSDIDYSQPITMYKARCGKNQKAVIAIEIHKAHLGEEIEFKLLAFNFKGDKSLFKAEDTLTLKEE